MPLHRPRRIFRGGSSALGGSAPPGLGGALAALAAAGLVGGIVLSGEAPDLLARAPAPAGSVAAEPQDVAVVDGGTLRLRDTVVRLLGVAAPLRGQSCPDSRGSGYDCGAAASAALAVLLRDRRVACQVSGRDRAGLAQGVCQAGGLELNQAQVATGWARAEGPALREAEATARAGRLGVWRNGAEPGF